MSAYSPTQFGNTVMHDFDMRRRGVFEGKAIALAGSSRHAGKALGHPLFDDLDHGDRRSAELAVGFIDLTDFTGRTFWDDAEEVADLAHAVLTGFIETVVAFGGFPLGLRGDGLFAGFGPGTPDVDVALALGACAFALDAVEQVVNPRLVVRGISPVQARAGLDFGQITFVRSGSSGHSEINPIGFAANFAAKCEKRANSWEVIVGEGIANRIGNRALLDEHVKSPKLYQRDYQRRSYKFFNYKWRSTLGYVAGTVEELGGHSSLSVSVR